MVLNPLGLPESWTRLSGLGGYRCESCRAFIADERFESRIVACQCVSYFPIAKRFVYNSGAFKATPKEFMAAYLELTPEEAEAEAAHVARLEAGR